MPARVGDRFGPYLLLHKIAQGGMGEVFLARKEGAEGFSRHVVVKRMLSHLADRSAFLEMFFAEARLASRLHHDRIVEVHDAGRIGDEFYLEMEFVAGVDFKVLLERCDKVGRKMPAAIACELVAQAAEGLAYAHRATDHDGQPLNLVHRDINPANLLISWDGEAKIIDLGIAKSALHHGKTETGMLKGKFLYMSPEQSEGKPVSGATDLFSLGIVLYEALLGRHPFDRGSLARTLAAIQADPLPTLVNPALFSIEPILTRVLAKTIADRYEDGDALARDLRAVIPELEPSSGLPALLDALFPEEKSYINKLLAVHEPQELRRLDRLTNPPLETMPTLPAGMDKPEGWTDFWQNDGANPEADTAQGLSPTEAPTRVETRSSTTNLILQTALSTTKRMWAVVGLLAIVIVYLGLGDTSSDLESRVEPASVSTTVVAIVDAAVAPKVVDVGPVVPRDAGAAKPAVIKPAVVKRPVVQASSSRLRIVGLTARSQAASDGEFRAQTTDFKVTVKWRRSEGGVVLSVRASPWAILYRNQGPALGRTPPIRQLRLKTGGREVLRFSHPNLGEFKLRLALVIPPD